MRPYPEILFQLPSLQQGTLIWASLDRNNLTYTVYLEPDRPVTGRLSATDLQALVHLLENSRHTEMIPEEEFGNGSKTIADLRICLASALVPRSLAHDPRSLELSRDNMREWIRGKKGYAMPRANAHNGLDVSRRDRLFRAFAANALGTNQHHADSQPPPAIRQVLSAAGQRIPNPLNSDRRNLLPLSPARQMPPILVVFAAERALVDEAGVRLILRPGESPHGQKWLSTVDDLSGDTVAVGRVSSLIAEFGFPAEAMAPLAAIRKLREAGSQPAPHPLFFVGSSYANPLLRELEQQDLEDYKLGARFDCRAPLADHALRVTFESRSAGGWWLERHHMDRSRDIAVIRRWRTRDGVDAIAAAGMTAQGTLGAVSFLCSETYVDRLYKYLMPGEYALNSDDIEHVEFDAVLGVPLVEGNFDTSEDIAILLGAPRQRPPHHPA